MKSWVMLLTAVAVVAVAGIAWSQFGEGMPVEAQPATVTPIAEFVIERGKTRLPKTYLITMPYAGRIEAIGLKEGDAVKAGQVVARIVPRDLELELRIAQESVDRLKAAIAEKKDISVENTLYKQTLSYEAAMEKTVEAAKDRRRASRAKLDFVARREQRLKSLPQGVTEQELESAELARVEADVDQTQDEFLVAISEALYRATDMADVLVTNYITRKTGPEREVLEEELSEAQARLEQAQQKVERGEMTSPVNGTVLERHVDNERYLPAGELLLEIGDLSTMDIEAEVLTQDAVQVRQGNTVEIFGPAVGDQPIRGTVTQVYPAGFTKVSSLGVEQQRVRVIVGLSPSDLQRLVTERGLGVGYRVQVKIITLEKEQVLTIPRSALFRNSAGRWQVFAVRNGRAQLQDVEVGLMNDERVEIVAGLEEGTPVVLAPETDLTNGTRVSIIQTNGTSGGVATGDVGRD